MKVISCITMLFINAILISSTYAGVDLSKPMLYGMVQVEQRIVSQSADGFTGIAAGGNTIENLPSRLGVIGFVESDDLKNTKLGYYAEIGFSPRKGTGEVKLRIAALTIEGPWGRLKMGQAYTSTALAPRELDPLWDTGAALIAYDQAMDIQGAHQFAGLGYASRWFRDVLEYRTPKFNGVQLSISADRDDDPRLAQVTSSATSPVHVDTNNYPATYYEALLSYEYSKGSYRSKSVTGIVKGSGSSLSYEMTDSIGLIDKDERIFIGTHQHFNKISFGVLYYHVKQRPKSGVNSYTSNRIMTSLKYSSGKNIFAITYGKYMFNSGVTETELDKKEASQIAIGYKRRLHKIALFNLTGLQYKSVHSNPVLRSGVNNEAYSIMAGISLHF